MEDSMHAGGRGDSVTYAIARVSPELVELLRGTPRTQHRHRIAELAAEFYLPVPTLLALDLVALRERYYNS
jgi:hypothetical protein